MIKSYEKLIESISMTFEFLIITWTFLVNYSDVTDKCFKYIFFIEFCFDVWNYDNFL